MGVSGLMVTFVGNGYVDPSSNPVWISYGTNVTEKGVEPIILRPAMSK